MLRLRYVYEPLLAGNLDAEKIGEVHFYVGGRDRSVPVRVTAPVAHEMTTVDVPWVFANNNKPSADSTLGIRAYSQIVNDTGIWCLTHAGMAHAPLKMLVDQNHKMPITIDLKIPQAQNLVKGQIVVHSAQYVGPLALREPMPPFQLAVSPVAVQEYVDWESHFLDQETRPSYPILSQIRVPVYDSEGISLPGYAFVMGEYENFTEGYFENLLNIAQKRLGSSATPTQLLGTVCSCYASACPYLSDQVLVDTPAGSIGTMAIEDFNSGEELRRAGDCEDGALQCMRTFYALKNAKLTQPSLQQLQRIAQGYVGFVMLKGVTSPALIQTTQQGGGHVDSSGIAGAHMDCVLIPQASVREMIMDHHVRTQLFPPSEFVVDSSNASQPVIILEPTGLLETTGTQDVEAPVRQMIFSPEVFESFTNAKPLASVAFQQLRTMAYQPRGEQESTPFYKACVFGDTPEFLARNGPVRFFFVDRNHSPPTIGVPFAPFGNLQQSLHEIGMVATPAPSVRLLETIQAALRQECPRPKVDVPRPSGRYIAALMPIAERFGIGASLDVQAGKHFDIFLHYSQVTPERVRALTNFVGTGISGPVEVFEEPIADQVGNIVVRFHPPNPNSLLHPRHVPETPPKISFVGIGAQMFGVAPKFKISGSADMPSAPEGPYEFVVFPNPSPRFIFVHPNFHSERDAIAARQTGAAPRRDQLVYVPTERGEMLVGVGNFYQLDPPIEIVRSHGQVVQKDRPSSIGGELVRARLPRNYFVYPHSGFIDNS